MDFSICRSFPLISAHFRRFGVIRRPPPHPVDTGEPRYPRGTALYDDGLRLSGGRHEVRTVAMPAVGWARQLSW